MEDAADLFYLEFARFQELRVIVGDGYPFAVQPFLKHGGLVNHQYRMAAPPGQS